MLEMECKLKKKVTESLYTKCVHDVGVPTGYNKMATGKRTSGELREQAQNHETVHRGRIVERRCGGGSDNRRGRLAL